jgi:hypothetical protein
MQRATEQTSDPIFWRRPLRLLLQWPRHSQHPTYCCHVCNNFWSNATMSQGIPWHTERHSTGHEINTLLLLSQKTAIWPYYKPLQWVTLSSNSFLKISVYIIVLQSTSSFSTWPLALRFPDQHFIRTSHVCMRATCPAHLTRPRFNSTNTIKWNYYVHYVTFSVLLLYHVF